MDTKPYVLISACRNEAAYLEGLMKALQAQTVPPLRWVIIDDGSTDDTYAAAAAWREHLPWLQVVRMPGGRPRSFASQVFAARHGYESVKELPFEFVGFLDADIRLQNDYYEQLLKCFERDSGLGLGGGLVLDQYPGRTGNPRRGSEDWHVAGGVQFFRRECFEQIGGYVPIEGGGQDIIADVMCRKAGWRLRSFPELEAIHLRPDGFAKDHPLAHGLKWGRKFYLVGYHPVFYLGQCARRLARRPLLVGSLWQAVGFFVAMVKREPRPVSSEFVRFHQHLQMRRLRQTFVPSRLSRA